MKLKSPDGTVYPLDKPQIRVGRSATNDIPIKDKRASGKHAVITIDGSTVIISDVGSSNGTFVNQNRVDAPTRLKVGDQVTLGDTVLTVVDDNQTDVVDGTVTELDFGPRASRPAPPPMPAAPPVPAAPPPPPMPQAIAPMPPAYSQMGYVSTKDKSTTIILEILPGLFGFLGIGWIYAGQTTTGILILLGHLVAMCVLGLVAGLTIVGLLCFIPYYIGAIAVSSFMLNDYTKKNPQLFR
jgi:FHA domain-containing protein